jgi:hypothetical protein
MVRSSSNILFFKLDEDSETKELKRRGLPVDQAKVVRTW